MDEHTEAGQNDFGGRRSAPRAFANDLLCKVSTVDIPNSVHANILNIGTYGLMVALKLKLASAMPVIVNIFLPVPFGEIALKGTVSWVAKEQEHYVCGIDFTENDEDGNLATMRRYVTNVIKDTNIVERRKSRGRGAKVSVERRAKRPR